MTRAPRDPQASSLRLAAGGAACGSPSPSRRHRLLETDEEVQDDDAPGPEDASPGTRLPGFRRAGGKRDEGVDPGCVRLPFPADEGAPWPVPLDGERELRAACGRELEMRVEPLRRERERLDGVPADVALHVGARDTPSGGAGTTTCCVAGGSRPPPILADAARTYYSGLVNSRHAALA